MIKETNEFEYCKTILQENAIFSNLTKDVLNSFLEGLKLKKWKKDTEFFTTNDVNENFYIILSGRVKIFQINQETGREFTVFLLKKHDVFDIISLLDQKKRSTNFKTIDNTEILSAPMNVVRGWIDSFPEINKTLLPYLGQRMRMLEESLTDNALTDIPTRLARLIARNIDQSSNELQLINDLSHNEIASMIGSTRAVVNRHIQNFKKAGILATTHKKTRIINLEKLLDKIESDL